MKILGTIGLIVAAATLVSFFRLMLSGTNEEIKEFEDRFFNIP